MNRPALLKMVHAGARRLGWDEETRRAWMVKHTAQSSCSACSDAELSLLVDLLRDLGALDPSPNAPLPATGTQDRPTQKQWRYALDLAKKIGLSGAVHDPALVAFCQRVTKVDHPRFLDRSGMQALVLGLENWLKSRQRKAAREAETNA
ncbi:MAG: regulatory protein GemA [Candidatus Accumulibacter sp.]|uniref:regulatory protein GemA n=1 Tax=Accumulibacter sp. TaxID=2053492 RepID=UPI00258A618C|nr:regulatory protein GemA [Accumulibacter sp.]MCM8622338.1 regulatory protein GemA [Accumulibacter sp.]